MEQQPARPADRTRLDPGTSFSPSVMSALAVALLVLGTAGYLWLSRQRAEPPRLRIAGGPTGGVYAALAERLAEILRAELGAVDVSVAPSAGSIDNAARLRAGDADLAFMQSDTSAAGGIRCVASLYEETLHIVVRSGEDAPNDLLDLRGRRLALGGALSGSEAASLRLLEHFGLSPGVDFEPVDLDPEAAARKFEQGEVDALFLFAAVPSRRVGRLLADGDAVLLSVRLDGDAGATAGVARAMPLFRDASVPAYTYGQKPTAPVRTVSVSALLTARQELDAALVRDVARVLFAHRRGLADVHPALAQMQEDFDAARAPAPLHPGARAWYERDRPHFLVEYAEAISLALTVVVGLSSGFLALRQWLKSRRKNRIDVYYLRLSDLAKQIAAVDDGELAPLRASLLDVRRQAFDDLVRERIDADASFIIFHDFLRDELRALDERLRDAGLRAERASERG